MASHIRLWHSLGCPLHGRRWLHSHENTDRWLRYILIRAATLNLMTLNSGEGRNTQFSWKDVVCCWPPALLPSILNNAWIGLKQRSLSRIWKAAALHASCLGVWVSDFLQGQRQTCPYIWHSVKCGSISMHSVAPAKESHVTSNARYDTIKMIMWKSWRSESSSPKNIGLLSHGEPWSSIICFLT